MRYVFVPGLVSICDWGSVAGDERSTLQSELERGVQCQLTVRSRESVNRKIAAYLSWVTSEDPDHRCTQTLNFWEWNELCCHADWWWHNDLAEKLEEPISWSSNFRITQ